MNDQSSFPKKEKEEPTPLAPGWKKKASKRASNGVHEEGVKPETKLQAPPPTAAGTSKSPTAGEQEDNKPEKRAVAKR